MAVLRLLLSLTVLSLAALLATAPAALAVPVTSKCLAVAQDRLPVVPAAFRRAALENNQVRITYIAHSTFIIESPKGIRAATDYAGWHGGGPLPDVVTMNHAHDTHYTDHPDPAIKHVLRGWNPEGGWAEYSLTVGDMYIRNVPTNIRSWDGTGTEKFGNSIFIFEVGGLCIGHLGHLQHELTAQQLGQIGRLDVVMAPVDGAWTLDHQRMSNVLKELHPRIIIPMHFFGSFYDFLDALGEGFAVRKSDTNSVILSPATMPLKPEVLVLQGH